MYGAIPVFKMDELLIRTNKETKLKKLLINIDVLVDEPFIQELKKL